MLTEACAPCGAGGLARSFDGGGAEVAGTVGQKCAGLCGSVHAGWHRNWTNKPHLIETKGAACAAALGSWQGRWRAGRRQARGRDGECGCGGIDISRNTLHYVALCRGRFARFGRRTVSSPPVEHGDLRESEDQRAKWLVRREIFPCGFETEETARFGVAVGFLSHRGSNPSAGGRRRRYALARLGLWHRLAATIFLPG